MIEMSNAQVDLVDGGEMSTRTKVIIGAAWVVNPIFGAGMTVGYYFNAK